VDPLGSIRYRTEICSGNSRRRGVGDVKDKLAFARLVVGYESYPSHCVIDKAYP